LFYFRDETFECVAEHCTIELSEVNSLIRTRKVLALPQQESPSSRVVPG
jgi:hypothetical protein